MPRPNIILITAPGLRHDCLGFAANPDVRTPNIDALAAHGIRFEQAITPAADPVRARLNLLYGHPDASPLHHFAALPNQLRQARYDTALIGILGAETSPAALGFETVHRVEQTPLLRDADDYHRWLGKRGLVDRIEVWDRVRRDEAPEAYWRSFGAMRSNLGERHHVTTWIGSRAVRYLQRV